MNEVLEIQLEKPECRDGQFPYMALISRLDLGSL